MSSVDSREFPLTGPASSGRLGPPDGFEDPIWIAESYLSGSGGMMEHEAELFVEGARKAGLRAWAAGLKDNPNLIRAKSCDEERAKSSEG
ncbi:hypothetical protein [Mesorhizobium sp. M1348]|uniref:hypothetical protein n=1 Tax=unclassified Mesorhizobium TaxID=325217 RepID=UPI003336759D